MFHRIPVAAMVIGGLGAPLAGVASAQSIAPVRVLASAATSSGQVQGRVRDDAGRAIADASILAVGQAIIAARTDAAGRFHLALPPGDYVLRAARDGYVSTYREAVNVGSRTRLDRTITMMRQAEAAPMTGPTDGHAHTDLAWQLRHLTRSVLRDRATGVPDAVTETEVEVGVPGPAPAGSFLARAVHNSARLATALFAETDFDGQVNFVTTASADPAGAWLSGALPRGVAFIVLGAPLGANGDWRVRGAIASGSDASWNLLGEYESREIDGHAMNVGLSYSAQGYKVRSADRLSAAIAETRSAAGIFARDRWRVLPAVELDYGVRADRYDYLVDPDLLSVDVGLRARVLPATLVTARASRSMVAPGADEFLPPPANGPWLPPERTFSALNPRDLLRAEVVRHAEIGIAREFGDERRHSVHVRAFRQQTADQIATLFDVRDLAGLGHYQVARVGTANVEGWAVGFGSQFLSRLTGQLEYAWVAADWHGTDRPPDVGRAAPSVVRHGTERLHDMTASLEAEFNETATRVSLVYRASTAFSQGAGRSPFADGRFDLKFHQALPYQPTQQGRLELLFAVRTLFRDAHAGASWYDELLTVGPPLRLMGGIQMRF